MRKTILVLEEEADLLSLIRLYFRRKNYHVFCAFTWSEAVTILQQNKIDLVLLFEVDDINCASLQKEIKAFSSNTKVICMNAGVNWQDIEHDL